MNTLPTKAAYISLIISAACAQTQAHELVTQPLRSQTATAVGQRSATVERKWNPDRYKYMPVDRQPHSMLPHTMAVATAVAPPFVIVLQNRWPVNQELHICFYGGDGNIRQRILSVAQKWLDYANLKFDTGGPRGRDCQSQDQSEIRIGFSEPGYWSYIGNDSIAPDLVSKNLASMNFEGFDKAPPPEPRFSGIVLHEFGHALGFHHEHQSPAEGCDKEYDWNKLYAFYKQAYGWDQKMVDDNVRELQADRRAYDWSPPDPKSIMVYASDPRFLLKGVKSPCYFHENDALSAVDQQGARSVYPGQEIKPALDAQVTGIQSILPTTSGASRDALSKQLDLAKKKLQTIQ